MKQGVDKGVMRVQRERGCGRSSDGVLGGPVRERRRFLWGMGLVSMAWAGGLLYPIYRYLAPGMAKDPFDAEGKAPIEGVRADDVARPGQGRNAGFAGGGIVVFRAPDGELRALSSKCTHAGCNVQFQGDSIHCHCHGGVYDLEGKNVSGPPPKPLIRFHVVERDGMLYVFRPNRA